MQLIQEVTGVNSNFANRLQRQKTAEDSFFFMLPWQGQQVNCNSWKPLGDRLELRVMCRFKKNKTKPMLHANIAAGLIQKNHWCLNFEPNSAYNLLVSRVLMNYFMREESIFRCYMFNCIHIVVRTH